MPPRRKTTPRPAWPAPFRRFQRRRTICLDLRSRTRRALNVARRARNRTRCPRGRRGAHGCSAAADASLEEHVRAGRVLPAERAGLAALLASLPAEGDDTVIRFAAPDGEGQVEKQPREILEALLAALPERVPYGERAGGPQPSAAPAPGFAMPADGQLGRGAARHPQPRRRARGGAGHHLRRGRGDRGPGRLSHGAHQEVRLRQHREGGGSAEGQPASSISGRRVPGRREGDYAYGVTTSDAKNGEHVSVDVLGTSIVEAESAVAVGTELMVAAPGAANGTAAR